MTTTPTAAWPSGAPRVGQRARRSRMVRERDIALFTEISGDRNPIHYDTELASRIRFGGIVVQGGVTSALLKGSAVCYTVALPPGPHRTADGGGPRVPRQHP